MRTNMDNPPQKRSLQRKLISKYVDGPVEFLIRHNVSANALSFLGLLCSFVAFLLISMGILHFPLWFAWPIPFFIFMAGAFDVFDGEVARKTNNNTKAGAFLDSNLDRLSDALLIFGMILGGLIDYIIGFILLFLVIMISYIRARAENEGVVMKGVGFMERAERVVILLIGLVLESWIYFLTSIFLGAPFTLFFPIFIYIFIILLLITIGQRIYHVFKSLREFDNSDKLNENSN